METAFYAGINRQATVFVREFLVDCNATQAAKRAGYSPKTATEQASRMLTIVNVQTAIAEAITSQKERTQVTQDWVINRLVEIVERAMQARPVLDKNGIPVGVLNFNAAAANRGLELLGKHLGLFSERHRIENEMVLHIEREPDLSTLSMDELRCLNEIAVKVHPAADDRKLK